MVFNFCQKYGIFLGWQYFVADYSIMKDANVCALPPCQQAYRLSGKGHVYAPASVSALMTVCHNLWFDIPLFNIIGQLGTQHPNGRAGTDIMQIVAVAAHTVGGYQCCRAEAADGDPRREVTVFVIQRRGTGKGIHGMARRERAAVAVVGPPLAYRMLQAVGHACANEIRCSCCGNEFYPRLLTV